MRSTNEQQSLQMNHSEKVKTAMEEGFDGQEGGGELLLLCTKPFQGLRIIVCEMVTDYTPSRFRQLVGFKPHFVVGSCVFYMKYLIFYIPI